MMKVDLVLVLRILFTVTFLTIVIHFFLDLNKDISSAITYDTNVQLPSMTFCFAAQDGVRLRLNQSTLIDAATKVPNPRQHFLSTYLYANNITNGGWEKIDLSRNEDLQEHFGLSARDIWTDTHAMITYTTSDNGNTAPGRCLIFNPPMLQNNDLKGMSLRFTVTFDGALSTSSLIGFFIHEPGQSRTNGLVDIPMIAVNYDTADVNGNGRVINYDLVHSKHTHVNREGYPCDESNSVKRHDCFNQMFSDYLNCTLPWMPPQEGQRLCSEQEDYNTFVVMADNLESSPYKEIVDKFGCLKRNCAIHTWQKFLLTSNMVEERGIPQKNVIIKFYQHQDYSIIYEDYVVYGLGSFWADFGGYLGLLLGIDLLSLILMGLRHANRVFFKNKLMDNQLGG